MNFGSVMYKILILHSTHNAILTRLCNMANANNTERMLFWKLLYSIIIALFYFLGIHRNNNLHLIEIVIINSNCTCK